MTKNKKILVEKNQIEAKSDASVFVEPETEKNVEPVCADDVNAGVLDNNSGSVENKGAKNTSETVEDEMVPNEDGETEKTEILLDDAVIDSEAVTAHLEEVEQTVQPKKKKKSMIWNLIFLAINLVFMAFVLKNLTKDASGASLGTVISQQGKRLFWLAGAVACFLGVYLANALSLSVFLKNITGKRRFGLCLKVVVLGKYYEFITPLAVGGQPSQILNLINGGITPGVATSIPIIRAIIGQLVKWVLLIIGFVFVVPKIPAESGLVNMLVDLLKILAIIGLIVATFASIGYVLLGASKIIGKKIAKFCIRIGYKLKIVKNYRKSYDKFIRQVIEYQSSMKYLAKNKSVLVRAILYALIEYLCFCSIGFFTAMAFSQTVTVGSIGVALAVWVIAIARFQVVDMASSVMVLPGGTGIKEIAFLIMFNAFFQNTGTVAWSFLSWRTFDYYMFLLVGFVILIIQIIRAGIIARKNKKQALSVKQK